LRLSDLTALGAERVTGGHGEERRPVAVALAPTDHELTSVEVDILDATGKITRFVLAGKADVYLAAADLAPPAAARGA